MSKYRAGLTLVEVTLLVCIVGIVLAVTVPTFIRTVRTSKVEEASLQLEALYRGAAAYFRASHTTPDGTRTRCLPPPAGPAPAKPSVHPVAIDFTSRTTPGARSWKALQFDPSVALRYRYTFAPADSGCSLDNPPGGPLIVLRAEGDLDGDGEYSTFERSIVVDKRGELVSTGLLLVKDRVE